MLTKTIYRFYEKTLNGKWGQVIQSNNLMQTILMARPLRIEYPGAVYHLKTRGNARNDIYRDDDCVRKGKKCILNRPGPLYLLANTLYIATQ